MLTLMWYLRDRLCYLRDQRGIETLEWVLIGGIVTGAAVTIYAALNTGLTTTVGNIIATINNAF